MRPAAASIGSSSNDPATGETITSSPPCRAANARSSAAASSGVPMIQRLRAVPANGAPSPSSASAARACSTVSSAMSGRLLRSLDIMRICGSARASASSRVGETTALVVRKVRGSGCASLGRYCCR